MSVFSWFLNGAVSAAAIRGRPGDLACGRYGLQYWLRKGLPEPKYLITWSIPSDMPQRHLGKQRVFT